MLIDQNSFAHYQKFGWVKFCSDKRLLNWLDSLQKNCDIDSLYPRHDYHHLWRCDGTWFVGVDTIPNDHHGIVRQSLPLDGSIIDFIKQHLWQRPQWHRGQLSVCFPEYPKKGDEDTLKSWQFRIKHHAAHCDGIHGIGKFTNDQKKSRFLKEHHRFILAIPLDNITQHNAPMMLWQESHRLIQKMLCDVFANMLTCEWQNYDITKIYQHCRRHILETITPIAMTANYGDAYLLHRHLLHGIKSWDRANHEAKIRRIIYFRPSYHHDSKSMHDWLIK